MEGGEAGAQVAPPILLQQALHGRFDEVPPLTHQNLTFNHNQQQQQQNHLPRLMGSSFASTGPNWSPKMWEWDSIMFVAKPSSGAPDEGTVPAMEKRKADNNIGGEESLKGVVIDKSSEHGDSVCLKLGGCSASAYGEPVTRPNKKGRTGSPGGGSGGNWPSCQVDDCKADLSNAKDYHRRHKVCQVHSKAVKALVGKQMQRFCQQCSRFHPLLEFDEGKRSCRQRLAGHNRRRRKIQPEEASLQLVLPGNQDGNGSRNSDIVSLLSILAHLQGNGLEKAIDNSSLHDTNHITQVLREMNSAHPSSSTENLRVPAEFDLNVSQTPHLSENLAAENDNPSNPSTLNLIEVLSTALKASSPENSTHLSQVSSDSSANDKATRGCLESSTDVSSDNNSTVTVPLNGTGSNNHHVRTSFETERPVQEARSMLRLFSSPEKETPELLSLEKNVSSANGTTMEEKFSSLPPVIERLFPLHSPKQTLDKGTPTCSDDIPATNTSQQLHFPIGIFNDFDRRDVNHITDNPPHQEGFPSIFDLDQSPSSSNSDSQDRTDRILFKLFDKDPSNIPKTLRAQIFNWLSHCPSEMESYIRPGCIVLSIYLSMPSTAWAQLHEDIVHRVRMLLEYADSDFWRSGEFLVHIDRQLVSHSNGKVHLCKYWETQNAPELLLVSPLAVVSGKKTTLVLKGRNLGVTGTKIHCTYMGAYTLKEVCDDSMDDECCLQKFDFSGGHPGVYGRCFIEVENDLRGNSFPVIIADESICQELRMLETEFEDVRSVNTIPEKQDQSCGLLKSREEILHFINELGWLFQRSIAQSTFLNDFSSSRSKFLLTFAVEQDWSALVKKILDILVDNSSGKDNLRHEYLRALSEVQLLSRAVRRKCRKMVNVLLQYSVNDSYTTSKVHLFLPNLAGPGGITPLHIAASMQDSEEMVDALTNDPQEIGLKCWDSVLDDSGLSPHGYASMRNHDSYNSLVIRKLVDRRNSQLTITIEDADVASDKSQISAGINRPDSRSMPGRSCKQCASLDNGKLKGMLLSKGTIYRPYINSLLAIATVCMCVSVFLRGAPELDAVAPFKWANIDFGTM